MSHSGRSGSFPLNNLLSRHALAPSVNNLPRGVLKFIRSRAQVGTSLALLWRQPPRLSGQAKRGGPLPRGRKLRHYSTTRVDYPGNVGENEFSSSLNPDSSGLWLFLPAIVGLWRSWERASMAWKRSPVRSRPGPPYFQVTYKFPDQSQPQPTPKGAPFYNACLLLGSNL